MQQRSKLAIGFTSIVLAGTIAIGSVASAAGSGDGDGGTGRSQLTTEQKCTRADEFLARAPELQERIAERIATLEEKRSQAAANDNTRRVERIDARLARLQRISERIDTRVAKVTTWVSTNCD